MTPVGRVVARSAVAHAATLEPGAPVRWRDLELAAFAAHPSVARALDPNGRRSSAARSPMGVVRTVLVALVALAPVWSLASLLGGRFVSVDVDGRVAVPAAAITTTIGLVVPLWLACKGLSEPSQRRPSLAGIGAIYLVVGVLLAVLAVGRAEPGQDIVLALVPFGATALVGLVLVVAGGILLVRGRPQTSSTAGPVPGPLPAARAAIARLSDAERDVVRGDLDAAIVDLERRGVADSGAASIARRADLGLLAVRMSRSPKR